MISLKVECKNIHFYLGAFVSNIVLDKMALVKCTKHCLDNLVFMREDTNKANPTYISEVTLNKFMFKESGRSVVQPR